MKIKSTRVYSHGLGMYETKEDTIYYDQDLDNKKFKNLKKFVIQHEKEHREHDNLWFHIKHEFQDRPKLILNKTLRKEIKEFHRYKEQKTLCKKWGKKQIIIYVFFTEFILPIITIPLLIYYYIFK